MGDEHYMRRAIDLAGLGSGSVSPNPMVGCVIVLGDKIIGEGYHKKAGEAHAEVNAIESVVINKEIALATFYITMEPCSYYGKTPACTDLLIKHCPKKVVVASKDPNPKVSGKGLESLQKAGIEVSFGMLEKEAILLNKRFYVNMMLDRPYVVLKWAETADGFISRKNYDSKWISNSKSRQLVHKWRKEEDAVLVGHRTVVHDNPSLNVRDWTGRNPVRVIIDRGGTIDNKAAIFNQPERVYYLNDTKNDIVKNVQYKILDDIDSVTQVLGYLYSEGIGSVIIEGGTATITRFLEQDLWDEARIFKSPVIFEEGINAPQINIEAESEFFILDDRLSIIFNPKTKEHWQRN